VRNFYGMTWAEVIETVRREAHLLSLGEDQRDLDIARAFRDQGEDAGAAVACAYTFLERHGAVDTIWAAIDIYDRLAPGNGRVLTLKEGVSWMGTRKRRKAQWPVTRRPRGREKEAGLANVMFFVASKVLAGPSNCHWLALHCIRDFLESR
jgi:hypothetical protein